MAAELMEDSNNVTVVLEAVRGGTGMRVCCIAMRGGQGDMDMDMDMDMGALDIVGKNAVVFVAHLRAETAGKRVSVRFRLSFRSVLPPSSPLCDTLLTHTSVLLTTGDDNAPLAHSVHAVYGRLTPAALECLVCSENVPQTEQETKGMQATPALPDPGRLTSIPDAGDANRGSQLLDEWDEADQHNYSLKDHLQDVFQIFSYLKPPSATKSLEAFSFFIHHRAFRKLGWRIKEFLTHLNDSPFTVLKTVDFTRISAQQFAIPFTLAKYDLLRLSKFPLGDERPVTLSINSNNVKDWLDGFQQLFSFLQGFFPCPRKEPTYALPTREAVLGGVGSIQLIMKLKPVLKHILSVSGVESTLLCAIIAARQKKPRHRRKILEAFQFPATPQASWERQPDNNPTNTKNMFAAEDVKDMFTAKDMEDTSAVTVSPPSSKDNEDSDEISDETAIENEDEKDNLPLTFPHTLDIFAWIPPRDVPDQILVELHIDLLRIVSDISAQHSRQTSTVSSNSLLDHTLQTDQAMAEVFKKLQSHTNTK
ncbi:hypothetical protein DFJ43DRAFT_1161970 [Lentinula guzmanii]|uniref:Uncharacterized protein n=1 Tax=Lentinula guzmanii TaxID=2804957 RepID=A0AA38MU68_9AGAR|nr:hypothetical protein DFJ43DRAFT_1161970 [Lentinula guzmanii]